MSHGPPPVPGGRTPEEREAARRERAARRAARQRRRSSVGSAAGGEGLTRAAAAAGGREAHVGRGVRPRWGRIIVAVAGVAVLGVAAWFLLSLFQPFHGDGEGDELRVRIPRGSTVGDIAQLLDRGGVIASAGFFELRARIDGRTGELKPGSYRLRENMSYAAVLDRLERGVAPNVVVVTVPEGRSRREIAPLVRELEGDYLRATRRSPALDPRD
jgi:hypothetical protein